MSDSSDRLYQLLPAFYHQRDAEQGFPLQSLLQVIAEQVDVVEENITQLYDNWFIETCEDWVVPYIADLIGYTPVRETGEPGDVNTLQAQQRNKILVPRRDVANTIRYRRRKGTLALLELLAHDVTNWHGRAVEFYTLLSWTQHLKHQRLSRGQTVNLRQALDYLDTAFNEFGHSIELRRLTSQRSVRKYNILNIGLFIWRLQAYSVTLTPAYCVEEIGSNCYTFSVLGNDTPLYNHPQPELEPTHIAEELNLPVPIQRRSFKSLITDFYGEGKSLQILVGNSREPIPPDKIVVANLTNWYYRPLPDKVAVDPELGRIVFPPGHLPKKGVWVSYHYGFSADIGGGEYDRPLYQPREYKLYQVGELQAHKSINSALEQWERDRPLHAIIEITDSGVYVEPIDITLSENQSLQLRAANRKRPVIRLLNWHTDMPDGLNINGCQGSRLTLDGLTIVGRGVQIEGNLLSITIRHSTLVPGWGLACDCEPHRPAEPSLELFNTQARLLIEHSIIGSIEVNHDQVNLDPLPITISDSILDATSNEREALSGPGCVIAHSVLTVRRSTVFGKIYTHAIALAENSLFNGLVKVARRQQGCIRFCYVPPYSRTPRRYNCQPDLVEAAVVEKVNQGEFVKEDLQTVQEQERDRVRPQYNSTRYGTPTYCQLAATCAEEIKHGADDQSEMGVFHDLYQPQRAANLQARLNEYTPAGMEVSIIYAS
ncbi:hypothetical protein [Iningainema tapete]|uniref:Uncharacterized protein n=1 Tax=Iningainema tapete BLCC-T55 TaxID=2748662 RepID=A0A8J6XHA8_9CYAN|nr:hypothetical protein [Iningainema tapete]MBD2773365.1 hypothetical protein [Iningainema tapete BLCC-T55]